MTFSLILDKIREYFSKYSKEEIIFKENYLNEGKVRYNSTRFNELFRKEIRSCRIGANTR